MYGVCTRKPSVGTYLELYSYACMDNAVAKIDHRLSKPRSRSLLSLPSPMVRPIAAREPPIRCPYPLRESVLSIDCQVTISGSTRG